MADEAGKTFFTITWKIHNGDFWLKEMKDMLVSGDLPDPNDKDNVWSLCIRRFRDINNDNIYIILSSSTSNRRDANLTFALRNSELFLLKSGDAETDHFKVEMKYDPDNSFVIFSIPPQELFDNWHIYFPNNILTICCKIPAVKNLRCLIDSVLLRKFFVWDIESFRRSSVSTKMVEVESVDITIQCTRLLHDKVGIHIFQNDRNEDRQIRCKIEQLNTNRECFLLEDRGDSSKELSIDTQYLGNDTLRLKLIFYDIVTKVTLDYEDNANNLGASTSAIMSKSLQKGLCSFFENQTFCDATLSTHDVAFPVHKNVLCAVSPVFCATFEGHTKEGQTGNVDIPDLDPDYVKRMLMFLYNDNNALKDIQWDGACKLYYAADKYNIISLKEACLSVLKDKLSTSNACSALVLADTHQDKDFMAYVQKFIASNDKVLYSSEWQDLKEHNTKFLFNMLQDIYLKSYLQHKAIPNSPDESNIQICLQNGLLRLYNAKMFCDATLKTNTATFAVHRNVLSAVSPVFCSLFKEHGDVVDIPDVDTDILKLILQSIYGHWSENLQWDESFKLYHAATFFSIQPLKESCLSALKSKLSVTNACQALILADQLLNKDLLTLVQDFISNHDEVITTEEWRRLMENNTKLVAKVMHEILLKNNKQTRRTSHSEANFRKKLCLIKNLIKG